MTDGKTFRQTLKEEKEKTSKMTGAQKWDYFCTYYLKAIIAILVVAAFLIYLIYNFAFGGENIAFEGATVNISVSDQAVENITRGFENFETDLDGVSELETDLNITFELEDTDQYAYANRMKLMSQVAAGELDYMFMSSEVYENLIKEDMFYRLDEVPEDFEYISDTGAIKLSEDQAKAILGEEYKMDVYLAFMAGSKHTDQIGEFLKYLNTLED